MSARLSVTGLVVAMLLLGCGGEDSEPSEQTTISSPTPATTTKKRPSQDRRPPAGDLCQSQLGSFVGSMDGLRRRLAVGVTYDQYVAEVRGIRSTYGEIPVEKLQVGCLTLVATPGEKAFNRYIEGANDWGKCVSELGCDTATIEPILQRRWRIASHFLSEAKDGLDANGG
ncbi:MAG: hypothetical protein M3Y75_08650 [Actinomycetota bacterium]|nr:hypothetical protein [Actinomycetota bacterium]